jgi:hypothetical protein
MLQLVIISDARFELSAILLQSLQRDHCLCENLFWRQVASQEHLNCKRECCLLLAEECSPHVFVIEVKLRAGHECDLLRRVVKRIPRRDDRRGSTAAKMFNMSLPCNSPRHQSASEQFLLQTSPFANPIRLQIPSREDREHFYHRSLKQLLFIRYQLFGYWQGGGPGG